MNCNDYSPGPVAGKTMAVCKHYILEPKEAAGGCKLPSHFMCDLWLEGLKKKAIAPRTKMEQAVLETFPGSYVVSRRAAA